MTGPAGGAATLTCVYCGAETESTPPYRVVYCHCRSTAETAAAPERHRRAA